MNLVRQLWYLRKNADIPENPVSWQMVDTHHLISKPDFPGTAKLVSVVKEAAGHSKVQPTTHIEEHPLCFFSSESA